MNSATQPIPVTLRGLTAGTLYRYVLSIYDFADDSNAAIFNGKAIADANGEAVVRIDGVLRDYAYQPRRRWEDGRQGYVPADLIGLPAVLTPIEDGSRFMMTSATVTVYDNNGNIVTSQSGILVWAGRTASWMSGEPLYGVGQWCDFALLGSGMVPHLPPVDTANMWLSLVLQWFRTDAATLHIGAHSAAITPTAAGCLAASFTLADLRDLAASDINGGNADSTYDETLDGGDSDAVADDEVDGGDSEDTSISLNGEDVELEVDGVRHVVAHFDECAAPFYVAWPLPTLGWMCFGFRGNTLHGGQPQVRTITDTMDADRIVVMEHQPRHELHTNFVTKEQYNTLCTLNTAREVYLYDSALDRGAWCTVENRGTTTAGDVMWRMQPFNLVLTEITHAQL